MKKLMTSMIIVLPLLILAIMLVSGAIVGLATHIYVERVEFIDDGAVWLVMTDESAPPQESLAVNVLPLKAENREVVFWADDEDVVTVNSKGVVTATGFGETKVHVRSVENAAKEDVRTVVVTDDSVHELVMCDYAPDMYKGDDPVVLTVEVLPHEALNKGVTWTSSAPEILSVQGGEVTCHGKGTVTVTASSVENPDITATAVIECHLPLVSISADETSVVTAETSAQFPEIVPYPADATYTVTYTSSDEDIAKVDASGAITFLKEGSVTITAEACDDRAHSGTVSVTYDCTNGYYAGPLFTQTEYTFDYDEFKKADLGIEFHKDPVGSEHEIVRVEFDREGLIEYEAGTESFILKEVPDTTPLGKVKITVHARKYRNGQIVEFDTDVCNVTVTRKTANLSFVKPDGSEIGAMSVTSAGVSFTEVAGANPSSGIGVLVSPANHTDAVSYSLKEEGGCAKLSGKSLSFTAEGTATVVVTAESGVSAELAVTYTKAGEQDKVIQTNDEAEVYVALRYEDERNFQNGILQFTTPDGYTAEYRSSADETVHIEGKKLVPKKGGFADVTVTFIPDPSSASVREELRAEASSFTVHVYVDRTVLGGDIQFDKTEGYTTSLGEISYTVTLNVPADAMEGKELYLGGVKAELSGDGLTAHATATFGGANRMQLTASVRYAESTKAFETTGEVCTAECTVNTTHGVLTEAPTVTRDGQPFDNKLHFADTGEEIVLKIDASEPSPADFVLTEEKISFTVGTDEYFTAAISVEGNIATVTLTAIAGTYGTKNTTLEVAGQSFAIELDVETPADTVEVKYGDKVLADGETYPTFLSALELTATVSRSDKKNISEASKKATYTLGGLSNDAGKAQGNLFVFTIEPDGTQRFTVECGNAHFSCTFEKKGLEGIAFEFGISYSDNGKPVSVGPFPCEGSRVETTFPQGITGSFDLRITAVDDLSSYLGGFDERAAEAYFTLDEKAGWTALFSVSGTGAEAVAKFNVSLPQTGGTFIGEELSLHVGEETVVVVLGKSDLVRIEFTGFNSADDSNGGDNYKGYQQVRVFAKQSDYAGDGNVVDYVRMPLVALSNAASQTAADLSAIVWTLTRHDDRAGSAAPVETVTEQKGNTVTYGGTVYTIEPAKGGSILKHEETVIAQGGKYLATPHVTWVDPYAEDGYAHIYFGDFAGLEESDVQNDYFGNFGEKAEWSPVPAITTDDGSGRTFTPSENAYTYLRVEAGDGAPDSSVHAHFNFNVLQDATLRNVFNAAGYYKYSNLVLHENLYGPGELDGNPKAEDAAAKGLILNSASLDKTLIYGNGYQINFEAQNASMAQYNESIGTAINRAYNTIIKCANPAGEISNKYQKMTYKMAYAYYCDLSYYYKFNPVGDVFYAKNTVFSCIPKTAVQLYYNNKVFYAENIVMTECGTAIQADNNKGQEIKIYYKGSIDILNYFNKTALSGLHSAISALYGEVVGGVKDYLEWHGKKVSGDISSKEADKIYVNVLAFAYSNLSSKTYIWNGDGYKTLAEGGGELSSGAKIACKDLAFNFYYALTYEMMNGSTRLDNAITEYKSALFSGTFTGTADMNSLFSTNRYIRLQCEFKKPGEKNYDHIQWHKNTVYRDRSLLGGQKSHTDDLRDSLKNTTWDDGSGVDANGLPFDPPAAKVAALLSETVLPSKRTYSL